MQLFEKKQVHGESFLKTKELKSLLPTPYPTHYVEPSAFKLELLHQYAKKGSPIFFNEFVKAFPNFTKKLLSQAPTLVLKEIELCAYSRLHFGTQEIALYTRLSVRAIESRKYRIRKKLQLKKGDNFLLWLIEL